MRRETDDRQAELPQTSVPTGYAVGGASVLLVAAVCLTWSAWDAPAPDPLRLRIFLLAWLVLALVLTVAVATRALPGRPVEVPRWVLVYCLGALTGVAVATTPWLELGDVFWHQLWWSVPMGAGLVMALRVPEDGEGA